MTPRKCSLQRPKLALWPVVQHQPSSTTSIVLASWVRSHCQLCKRWAFTIHERDPQSSAKGIYLQMAPKIRSVDRAAMLPSRSLTAPKDQFCRRIYYLAQVSNMGQSSSTVVASASSSVSKSASTTVDDSAMVSSMSDPECSVTEGTDEETEPLAQKSKRRRSATRTRDQRPHSYAYTAQEPFQVGSTIDLEMKRRILQWNPVGSLVSLPAGPIVATSDEPARQIELEFSDVSRRSIRFPDRYGFQYGALNTNAMFLAAKSSDNEPRRPALVYYRPHESWSPNSDWVRYLPLGEEPIALGMGKLWVAVATTAQAIRLYSFTGLVTDNFHPGLSGGILTLVANDDHLCILSRGTGPQSAGEFLLLRIHENGHVIECLANGPLPLPATEVQARPNERTLEASHLVWAGLSDSSERASQETADCSTSFSDAGLLWIYHATGHLYMLRPWTFGCYRSAAWTWSPGCHPLSGVQRGSMHLTWQLALTPDSTRAALERDADAEPIEPGETWFYPLGVRNLVLYGVVVDRGLRCPAAYPRPQVRRIPLERYPWPSAHDGQSSELEQTYLTTATALRATQSQLFDAVAFEHAITAGGYNGAIDQPVRIADLADKARQLQRKADKLLLYLIEQACEAQRDRRVMDLVSRLSSATAFKLAVQIANRLKRAILADKIAKLAEARLEALGETSTLVEQLANLDRSRRKVTQLSVDDVVEPSPEPVPCPVTSAVDTKFTAVEEAATGAAQAPEPLHLQQLEAEQVRAGPRSRTGPSVRAAAAAFTATSASTEAKTSHPSLHVAERLLPLTRTQMEPGAATGDRAPGSNPLAVLGALQK
ncbi:WD repeat and HMG-box DNA binding-domain containing protein 1 [Cyanidiococcus yangmingshanensis]|uniref:WD repeat and HMG-box DNA binding-domain containing protein 1 n=1 Tax=Cyanidiococcus yangmingshanensis TaxID=2690220 RepID=A0A7J7IDC7_9RHOD|nr:WD repeat and HMG-box DNA binding-domain containing protein 1 [Cyanidiococcus yangmingshanensis]